MLCSEASVIVSNLVRVRSSNNLLSHMKLVLRFMFVQMLLGSSFAGDLIPFEHG